jgi:hypothetical protein
MARSNLNRVLGISLLISLFVLPIAFILFGIIVLELLPIYIAVFVSFYFYKKSAIEKRKRDDLLRRRSELLENIWKEKHRGNE